MRTQIVSIRVPQAWVLQLQSLAEHEGCEMSKVVKDAIARLLEIQTPDSVESLQRRVSRLERQVKRLLSE